MSAFAIVGANTHYRCCKAKPLDLGLRRDDETRCPRQRK
jgi:hypothetical protein